MSDLTRRLSSNADFLARRGWSKSAALEREAAAEIERLRDALTASEAKPVVTDDTWEPVPGSWWP